MSTEEQPRGEGSGDTTGDDGACAGGGSLSREVLELLLAEAVAKVEKLSTRNYVCFFSVFKKFDL